MAISDSWSGRPIGWGEYIDGLGEYIDIGHEGSLQRECDRICV